MRIMPTRSSTATALSGRHALVTGASSGLGADFARELAGRGAGLTLVARREDRLRALQRELAAAGADVRVVALDLNEPGAPDRLAAGVEADGLPVDVFWSTTPGSGSTARSASWTGSVSGPCSSWT
jgi:short-subunit dehydrogenase